MIQKYKEHCTFTLPTFGCRAGDLERAQILRHPAAAVHAAAMSSLEARLQYYMPKLAASIEAAEAAAEIVVTLGDSKPFKPRRWFRAYLAAQDALVRRPLPSRRCLRGTRFPLRRRRCTSLARSAAAGPAARRR